MCAMISWLENEKCTKHSAAGAQARYILEANTEHDVLVRRRQLGLFQSCFYDGRTA